MDPTMFMYASEFSPYSAVAGLEALSYSMKMVKV